MKNKSIQILMLCLFCFSCNKQYECVELQRGPNGTFLDDTLHIWFIYSKKQYLYLTDSSKHGQYQCSSTDKFKIKKTKYSN